MTTPTGSTSTTTPGMLQAASILANTQQMALNSLTSVQGSTDTLRGSWMGEASTAYSRSIQNWVDDCGFIIRRLGDMIELLDHNRQVISSGEDINVDTATNIPVGPGASAGLPIGPP